MTPFLRYRVALVLLLGVFLIPVATSSLRGLTHVLTCEEAVETPFTVVLEPGAEPVVLSSVTLSADQDEGLCGGLEVTVHATLVGESDLEIAIPVVNRTDGRWIGTMALEVGGVSIPVDIGRVPAGEERVGSVTLHLAEGLTELSGSLLVGP